MSDNELKKRLNDLEVRKSELRAEIKSIESKLESDLTDVQKDVSGRMHPVWWVKKYPIRTVGIAVAAGFLIGHRNSTKTTAGATFTAALIAAVKAFAARKLVDNIADMIESREKQ